MKSTRLIPVAYGLLFAALSAGCGGTAGVKPAGHLAPFGVDDSLLQPDQSASVAPVTPAPPPVEVTPEAPAPYASPVPPSKTQPLSKAVSSPAPTPAPAKVAVAAHTAEPAIVQPRKVEIAAPVVIPVVIPAAKKPDPTLDVKGLTARLKDTNAIGVFTKLALKNQMDDLLQKFRNHYQGGQKTSVTLLRQPYDMLVLKVLAVLQDGDPSLARSIADSREAIWGILADAQKFSQLT